MEGSGQGRLALRARGTHREGWGRVDRSPAKEGLGRPQKCPHSCSLGTGCWGLGTQPHGRGLAWAGCTVLLGPGPVSDGVPVSV